MMRWFFLIVGLLCPGCRVASMNGDMPPHFTLKLTTASVGQQFTYFELDSGDMLHFAGGRDVLTRATHPLLKVTPEQRRELWNTIVKYNLRQADGELFPSKQRVKYDFALSEGSMSLGRSFSAADDDVPGLAQLHEQLMALRSQVKLDSPLPGPE